MSKYRLMIIDDDEDARRMVGLALSHKFEIVYAYDGLDALSKLETHEPDLAIIDVMMPIMDGYQVCASIRRNPQFKDMPVLFLSAYGTKEHIRRAYEVGANLFMTKPVDPDRIMKNLEFTLNHETPPLRRKRLTVEQIEAMEREQQAEMARQQQAQQPPRAASPTLATPTASTAPTASAASSGPASQPAPVSAPKPATGPAGERPRVMLVDDDTDLLMMLEIALRDDFEVVTASNGMEAVERLVDFQPDLMLLDIMMPKMNGYQLLQSVRRNPPTSAMPVIILSAKSSTKDQEYAARLGATLFLTKPCPIDHLLRTLSGITHGKNFRLRPKRLTLEQPKARMEGRKEDHHQPENATAKKPNEKTSERWEG